MAQAVKFLHASDLHLDRAIRGLAEIPPHLKSVLTNAPYLAAENIFHLAVAEKVDFMLLSGDVLDLDEGGPRAALFLLTQFERLAERGIPVYWCSGSVDQPDRWPSAAALPDNVTTITSTGFEEFVCTRGGQPIATIYGTGYYSGRQTLSDLRVREDAAYPIALLHQGKATLNFDIPEIRYWALGGNHLASIVEHETSFIVSPGTPQARCPDEPGPHSCALVRVDAAGKTRVDQIPVDVVRWLPQSLSMAESASDEDIKNLLADRGLKLAVESPEQVGLVEWKFTTTGDYHPRLRSTSWKQMMISWLRTEFGSSAKGLWTTDIEMDATRTMPTSWYDEDTMLGDYLRAMGKLRADPKTPFNLSQFIPTSIADDWRTELSRIDESERLGVLLEATRLGIERLGAFAEKD